MIEPIRIVRHTLQLIAAIPISVAREDIRKVMGPGLAELRAAVAGQAIAVTGPWFTHHLRNPAEMFEFEICVPVDAPVAPSGRMRPSQWAEMTLAQTTHHGGYENLGSAWGDFLDLLKAAGHGTSVELWERYVVGPEASSDPATWRTELSKQLTEAVRQSG